MVDVYGMCRFHGAITVAESTWAFEQSRKPGNINALVDLNVSKVL